MPRAQILCCLLKGTVSVILNDPLCKDGNSLNLQRYPWNINLIKNVEDTVVFLTKKVLLCVSFSISSYKQEMCKSFSQRNHKQNWTADKAFKGTVVNRALTSLRGKKLEIYVYCSPFKEWFYKPVYLEQLIWTCWTLFRRFQEKRSVVIFQLRQTFQAYSMYPNKCILLNII